MKKQYLCLLFLLYAIIGRGQEVKGLYVNDFIDVVGDTIAENELLNLAQSGGFNYLILYNLYHIHNNLFSITDPVEAQPLADFMHKAKTSYGIEHIAATGETYASFANIHDYQLDHVGMPTQQFDYYNIEFEFWNTGSVGPGGYYCTTYLEDEGLSCDTLGAFAFLEQNLCDLKTLCDTDPSLSAEMYVGHLNAGQGQKIAECTDRVLVHYYRTSDVYNDGSSIYNYHAYRLPHLAADDELSVVMPIFSCRSYHMGPWLDSHNEAQVFDTWMNGVDGYNDDMGAWKSNNHVEGYVWYRYTCIPLTALPIELLYFGGRNSKKGNLLYWETGEMSNFSHIEIERKNQQNDDFVSLKEIVPPFGRNTIWVDSDYQIGRNIYRLKLVDMDGSYVYSDVVTLFNESQQNKWRIGDEDRDWSLWFDGNNLSSATIVLTDIWGRQWYNQQVIIQKGLIDKITKQNLPKGIYCLNVYSQESQVLQFSGKVINK